MATSKELIGQINRLFTENRMEAFMELKQAIKKSNVPEGKMI